MERMETLAYDIELLYKWLFMIEKQVLIILTLHFAKIIRDRKAKKGLGAKVNCKN